MLETELQIRRIQDLCLIECLVQKSSASGRSSRTFYHSTSGTESQRDESSKANTSLSYSAALSAGSGGEKRVHGGDEEGESVGSVKEEEEEIEELNEADADADADFSQLEDHHQHTAANAHDNQAHLPGPSRVEVGFKFSSASATDGGSPVRSGFRGSSNSTRLLDESSSFEADSPSPPAKTQQARAYAGDFKSSGLSVDGDDNFAEKSAEVEKPQDSNTAVAGVRHQQHQQTTMADDVDDSFAEESVQEEEGVVEEVDESFASAEKSPVQQGGESTRKEEHKYDSEGEGDDDGPEYDSDAADSHHSEKVDYKQEQKQSSPPSPPSKQAAAVAALTAEDKSHFSPTFSSANEKEGPAAAALQRATAGDFDRLDRIDIHPDMAARRANARNRVAVQRAGGSASAEGKDTVDESAGAKASVFRLGQVK